jgi:hypothetical protein
VTTALSDTYSTYSLPTDLKNSGKVPRTYMSTYLTAAFEYLFRILKESSEVYSPADLADLITSGCFEWLGNPRDVDLNQFSSWLLDSKAAEMKSLMAQVK